MLGDRQVSTQSRSPRLTAIRRGGVRRTAEDDDPIAAVERNLSCGNGLGLVIGACPPV